jgi:hypothetical protein
MLLDMLAPIARKDYEDRRRTCQAFGCAVFPSDGAKSPARSRLLTGGGFFLASESLVDVSRSYNNSGFNQPRLREHDYAEIAKVVSDSILEHPNRSGYRGANWARQDSAA